MHAHIAHTQLLCMHAQPRMSDLHGTSAVERCMRKYTDYIYIYVTPRFKTCPVLKPAGSYVAITDPKPNPNLSPAESHH